MFKQVHLLTKKQGMSFEDFQDYYETHHRKMIESVPDVSHYVRRYIKPLPQMSEKPVEYDVITEVWFENEEVYHQALARASTREFRRLVAEDEDKFLDRSKSVVFCVEERVG